MHFTHHIGIFQQWIRQFCVLYFICPKFNSKINPSKGLLLVFKIQILNKICVYKDLPFIFLLDVIFFGQINKVDHRF